MSLSAGRFLHSAKKVQGIGVAVEPVLCKRYIVSANQIQLLTRQFCRAYSSTFWVSAANPTTNGRFWSSPPRRRRYRGFTILRTISSPCFYFFIGDLLGAVIGHGGAGDENLLLRGALLHRLLHLQRTGDVHSGDRWRRRQADRPGDQRHLRRGRRRRGQWRSPFCRSCDC